MKHLAATRETWGTTELAKHNLWVWPKRHWNANSSSSTSVMIQFSCSTVILRAGGCPEMVGKWRTGVGLHQGAESAHVEWATRAPGKVTGVTVTETTSPGERTAVCWGTNQPFLCPNSGSVILVSINLIAASKEDTTRWESSSVMEQSNTTCFPFQCATRKTFYQIDFRQFSDFRKIAPIFFRDSLQLETSVSTVTRRIRVGVPLWPLAGFVS